MISNNPSGPEGEVPSEKLNYFDSNAARKLEESGLGRITAEKLASFKNDLDEKKISEAYEDLFPGENNEERIKNAMATLRESKNRLVEKLGQKSKAERISLAKNITPPESLDSDHQGTLAETTDGLKAFSSYSVPVFAKTVGKFFTDIPAAFADFGNSAEYLMEQANGIYKEPKTTNV